MSSSKQEQVTEQVVLPSSSQDNTEQEDIDTVAAPVQAKQQEQQSQILKDIQNTMLEVSQDHMTDIVNDLKEGFIRLEYIDSKGKMQIDRRQYNPMTIGMNKQIMKAAKRLRLLKADIKGMGKDGGMDVGKIQEKYPDILPEDVDEFDLTDPTAFNEMELSYIFSEKAKIFWGLNNIDNYSLHDIMIVATLYQSRNTFSPSS